MFTLVLLSSPVALIFFSPVIRDLERAELSATIKFYKITFKVSYSSFSPDISNIEIGITKRVRVVVVSSIFLVLSMRVVF